MRQIMIDAYPTLALLVGLMVGALGLLTPTFPTIAGLFVLGQLGLLLLYAFITLKVFRWMSHPPL